MKKSLTAIWIMFAIFVVLFYLNLVVPGTSYATQRMWLLIDLWAVILSIILLIKLKLPSRKSIIISTVFGLLVSLSYINAGGFSLVSSVFITVLSSMAVIRTSEVYGIKYLCLIKRNGKLSIGISITLGILVGTIWGAINYFLMLSTNQPNFSINIKNFLVAISPAILEEIAMRSLFFAFCIHLLGGRIGTKVELFTCWFMMMVPHVLIHTPNEFIEHGVVSGIIIVCLYIAIFALPFAVLQRKRDLASAMIAHGTVDAVRFCFFLASVLITSIIIVLPGDHYLHRTCATEMAEDTKQF